MGYSKMCSRWVSRQLTEAHKKSCLEACSELLEYCHSDKTFLQRIVTEDENLNTLIGPLQSLYNAETKLQFFLFF